MASPTIEAVAQKESDKTTIVIQGSDIKKNKKYTVTFGDTAATEVEVTGDGWLKVKLPKNAKAGPITVIEEGSKPSTTKESYAFTSTTISDLSTYAAGIGETVIITGTGFDKNKDKNLVEFNGAKANVTYCNETVLAVTVPLDAKDGDVTWRHSDAGIVVRSKGKFAVKGTPKITSTAPDKAKRGETVEIKGSGFAPAKEKNDVKFGSVTATIAQESDDSVVVTVPDAAQTGPTEIAISKGEYHDKIKFIVEPELEPKWLWAARIGGQTSTFSDGITTEDKKLFRNNYLFLDLSLTIPQLFGKTFDGNFVTRFGRQNIDGTTPIGTDMKKTIKDAEAVEAYGAVVWKPRLDKCWLTPGAKDTTTFYVKPTFGFIYDIDDATKDQDVMKEYNLNLGWMLSDASYLRGSLVEIGAGYSERFEDPWRFRSTVEVKYKTKSGLDPFIAFKYNMGVGPDDLVVYYGVSMDPKLLFEGVANIFTGEKKEESGKIVNSL